MQSEKEKAEHTHLSEKQPMIDVIFSCWWYVLYLLLKRIKYKY